jgi:hypothetical protein
MGLLSIFAKPAPTLLRLPAGSFTIDRQGAILVSTLPSSFPRELVDEIGQQVLAAFSSASQIQLALLEVNLTYQSLRIVARELRGGAIVFLSPRTS